MSRTAENENILKLIFISLSILKIKQAMDKTNNTVLTRTMINLLNYESLFHYLGTFRATLDEHEAVITSMTLTSDNKLITASKDKTLKIWNLNSYLCIKTLEGHNNPVHSVLTLPNGIIISCTNQGEIKFWDPRKYYECIRTIRKALLVNYNKLFLLSNGNIACRNDNFKDFIILDQGSVFENTKLIKGHTNGVTSFVNISNNHFASGSVDSRILFWDADDDCIYIKELEADKSMIYALLYIPKAELLISSSFKFTKLWRLCDLECIKSIETRWVNCLAILPCGYFVTGSLEGHITIRDIRSFKRINEIKSIFYREIDSLIFLKDGKLVCLSPENKIIIWKY
jgi:WD40 repeat protein